MTRIAYVSDLHLEFYEGTDTQMLDVWSFLDPLAVTGSDAIVLAGDIANLRNGVSRRTKYFLDSCVENTDHVYWVAGNHEYYYSEFPVSEKTFYEVNSGFKGKVSLLEELTQIQMKGGVRAVMGTAWSKISDDPFDRKRIDASIADFHVIKTNAGRFTANDCRLQFEAFREAYEVYLDLFGSPDLVVTHFLPSWYSVSERFRGGQTKYLNPYFCNFLLDATAHSGNPQFWIHGHTHDRFDYEHPVGTRVLANPYGYPGERSQGPFNRSAVIEIQPRGT